MQHASPNLKPCQFCGESIQAAATKCRYCHEWLSSAVPSQTQSSYKITLLPPNNFFVWSLVLVPLIGAFIESALATGTSQGNGDGLSMSITIYSIVNLSLIGWDVQALKSKGYEVSKIGWWSYLFVPVYLFRRAAVVRQTASYGYIWLLLFAASFAVSSVGVPQNVTSAPSIQAQTTNPEVDEASSPQPQSNSSPNAVRAGSTVAADTGGETVWGTVQSVNSSQGTAIVTTMRNETFTVALDKITLIPANQNLQVGDSVIAVWSDERMYPGIISSINGNEYIIKWSDGDTPQSVSALGILKSAPSSAAPTQSSSAAWFEIVRRDNGPDSTVLQVRVHGQASWSGTDEWCRQTAASEYPNGRGMINLYSGAIDSNHLIASYQGGTLYDMRNQ